MTSLLTSESLLALLTLTVMEIVLGIDNIIFIAILVAKVPRDAQRLTRNLGIALALLTRLGLLFSITWVMSLTRPLVNIIGRGFSGRDLILLVGGLGASEHFLGRRLLVTDRVVRPDEVL